MVGTRGPVKGKGGRPTKRAAKKTTTKKATAAKPPRKKAAQKTETPSPDESLFAADLAEMTFSQLVEHASKWRPLSIQDQTLVAVLWESVRRYRVLSEHVHSLDPSSWTFTTDKGYQGQIPEIGLLNKAIDQIAKLSARFGMSPADRARMGESPPKDEKKTPFANHMSKVQELSGEVANKSTRTRR